MRKNILRIISGVMLIAAIVFLSFALTHSEFGTVFYIGPFEIGSAIWRAFYVFYVIVMIGLFAVSFIPNKTKAKNNK